MRLVFIWTWLLGGPHPPISHQIAFCLVKFFSMNTKTTISHTMTEVMQKLQHTDDLDKEEDFLVITDEDLEARVEESKKSCYGKIMVDQELNIQNIRRSLRRAWRGHDFRVCKIGTNLYQFFFSKKEALEFILANGPWNVDGQLLLLTPWIELFSGKGLTFAKTDFWVQVSGLPVEWYFSRIGRKLFSCLKDCSVVELLMSWGSKEKFDRLRMAVQVDRPLRRFLRAKPSI